jgi:uracil phosphoribosyltransferase
MKNIAFEEITLMGFKIHIHEDKIQIFNDKKVPFDDFKETSDRLIRYLIDEAFVEKRKHRVEIVTP